MNFSPHPRGLDLPRLCDFTISRRDYRWLAGERLHAAIAFLSCLAAVVLLTATVIALTLGAPWLLPRALLALPAVSILAIGAGILIISQMAFAARFRLVAPHFPIFATGYPLSSWLSYISVLRGRKGSAATRGQFQSASRLCISGGRLL